MCARGLQYCDNVVMPRESILRSEAKWLKSIEADIVVLRACILCSSRHV